jgi:uncharacterized Zn finger protein (UPF0148 family)
MAHYILSCERCESMNLMLLHDGIVFCVECNDEVPVVEEVVRNDPFQMEFEDADGRRWTER